MSCYLRTWPTLNLWAPVAPWRTRWFSFLFSFFPLFWTKKTRSFVESFTNLFTRVGQSVPPSPTSERQPTVRVPTPPPCAKKRIHSQPAHMHAWHYIYACMHACIDDRWSFTSINRRWTKIYCSISQPDRSQPPVAPRDRPLSRDSKISAQRKEPLLLTRRSSERGL
jgi:hypothetical protein